MKTIAITAIITDPKKGILIYKRDDGNGRTIPYPNTWSFFGGTVEKKQTGENETPLECLVREMEEELELKLDPNQCTEIYIYDHDSGTDHVFHCPIDGSVEMHLHEGREKAWKSLREIKKLKLAWCQEQLFHILDALVF